MVRVTVGIKIQPAVAGFTSITSVRPLGNVRARSNESGQPLSYSALDNRFEEARKRAGNALDDAGEGEAAAAVKCFQFRDLRAKAGTDKADATDMREAQQQLAHKSVKTTELYLRSRAGEKVTPTK